MALLLVKAKQILSILKPFLPYIAIIILCIIVYFMGMSLKSKSLEISNLKANLITLTKYINDIQKVEEKYEKIYADLDNGFLDIAGWMRIKNVQSQDATASPTK